MKSNGYYLGDLSENYYKTLICTASFFAMNNRAAEIFKDCNDNEDQQNVNFID